MKQQQLYNISILRCFATTTLVIWHSYCSYVCWGVADTPANGFYSTVLTRLIPDANMPLFTILAGYLFYYLLKEKGKYTKFKDFLINKVNRLLIPFIILGSVVNLCEYGKDIRDIIYGTPNHLWYCLMLFYVYICFWIVEKYVGHWLNAMLAVISLLVVTKCGLGVLSHRYLGGLFLPLYYYVYFYVGFIFRKFSRDIKAKYLQLLALASLIIFVACTVFNNTHLIAFTSIAYFVVLLEVAETQRVKKCSEREGKASIHINTFSRYSFGVYVFHQWIIWNLTREPHCVSVMKPLLTNHYIIAPIILVIVVLTVSLLLTHYSLKTKVGRYLLL